MTDEPEDQRIFELVDSKGDPVRGCVFTQQHNWVQWRFVATPERRTAQPAGVRVTFLSSGKVMRREFKALPALAVLHNGETVSLTEID